MKNFNYPEFLRNLRQGQDLRLAVHDAAETKSTLDLMIQHAEGKAESGADLWKELKKAASYGPDQKFTYPAEAESTNGVKGETVSAQAEAVKIIVRRIQNFASAMSWASDFYIEENLKDDEQPYITLETRQAVRVAKVGQDGGYRSSQIIKAQSQMPQTILFILQTPKVWWKIFDILAGNVGDENQKIVDVAADVALELDQRLAAQLPASGGGFNFTTGSNEQKTLNLHPNIITANLPTTNVLTTTLDASASSLTSEGGVTEKVITAAMQYCAQFGNVFKDGDIYPVAFYYPSIMSLNNAGRVSLTTTTGTSALAEQVYARGFIEEFLGRKFAHRPIASLGGNYVYVRTNKPLGILYRKKGLDRIIRKSDEDENEGSVRARIVAGFAIPESWRVNLIKIQVKS